MWLIARLGTLWKGLIVHLEVLFELMDHISVLARKASTILFELSDQETYFCHT